MFRRSLVAIVAAASLVMIGLVSPASAQESPVSATASTMWQTNNTVRALAYANGKIYVGGEFTTVRPPGAAAGTQEVARPYLAAFDAATGALVSTWDPQPNARVWSLAASPDGRTVYVGGDFTRIAGAARGRLAAFDTTTGALQSTVKPYVSYRVAALAVDDDAVYLGGAFGLVAGLERNRLAAVSRSTGAVLPWNPDANWDVYGIDLSAAAGKVFLGGMFDTIGGVASHAAAAVDMADGAMLPLPAKTAVPPVTNSCNARVRDVLVSGENVYFGVAGDGGGCFDGTFSAAISDGTLRWRNTCLGATEALAMVSGMLFKGSHAHDCSSMGGFPQGPNRFLTVQDPATGLEGPWWPNTNASGSTQVGPLAMATDGTQLFVGGDFTTVNKVGQQGVTRFAAGPDTAPRRPATPAATSTGRGEVKVTFPATLDDDDENLTYSLYRAGVAAPVWTTSMRSRFWDVPVASYLDRGLVPGAQVAYRVEVSDGTSTVQSYWTNYLTVSDRDLPYPELVAADGAQSLWRFEESSGTYTDSVGDNDASASSVSRQASGILDGSRAVRLSSSSSRVVAQDRLQGPQRFSVEAWVKTTTTRGGKIVGFGSSSSGTSSSYDRHLYMGSDGKVTFGVYSNQTYTVRSTDRVNDGRWHHVVGSFSPGRLELFVDGVSQGTLPATAAEVYQGYWRIGNDNLGGWPDTGNGGAMTGDVDEVAVYPIALTAADVMNHYRKGAGITPPPNTPPTASFVAEPTSLDVAVDAGGSTDPDGSIVSWSWAWGDGSSSPAGSSPTATHTYAAGGTYDVVLTVTDNEGATATSTRSVTVTPPPNAPPVAAVTLRADGLTASADGAQSSDADGSIVGYAWSWGDGTTTPESGTASATHTYAAAGDYTVTLTVRDDRGATATKTATVSVAVPTEPSIVVEDLFDRTVSNGLGTAPGGAVWTVAGTASRYGVTDGRGWLSMRTAGNAPSAALAAPAQASATVSTSFSTDKPATGGGVYVSVIGRSVANVGDYRLKVRMLSTGAVAASVSKVVGGVETTIASDTFVEGVSHVPGTDIHATIQVVGASPTVLRARIWAAGSPEPTTWQLTGNDAEAGLQVPGGFALATQLSGSATNAPVTASFDAFTVKTVVE